MIVLADITPITAAVNISLFVASLLSARDTATNSPMTANMIVILVNVLIILNFYYYYTCLTFASPP